MTPAARGSVASFNPTAELTFYQFLWGVSRNNPEREWNELTKNADQQVSPTNSLDILPNLNQCADEESKHAQPDAREHPNKGSSQNA
jgi:hypothetical protein